MSLRADLDVALDRSPSRAHCLDVARYYRKLLTSAMRAEGDNGPNVMRIGEALAIARDQVVRIFGTSAWDEALPPLPPSPGGSDT